MDQNLKDADEALGLSPQEADLYKEHLMNLYGSGGVDNKDEAGNVTSRSSLYQATVQGPDDRWYNIPTVMNGKKEVEPYTKDDGTVMDVPNQTAMDNVRAKGWDRFPSYRSPEEADARYEDMHKFMEKDTGDYFAQKEAGQGSRFRSEAAPEGAPDFGAPGQIDRSRIRSELEQNPALADRLNQMVRGEVGDHASPEVRRIQMETAMNRALARGHSLDQALWDTAGHGNAGYYPHQSFTRGGFDKDTFGGDLEAVLSGSNYAGKYGKGLITGNASADVARHQFARGTPGFTVETGSGPESYFSEGPFKTPGTRLTVTPGGFMPEEAQLSRQGLSQMPVTFPGRMSVPSDTSNFPPSGNVDDRRQPGPILKIKVAANDVYMVTRHMLGLNPAPGHGQTMDVKNPDDRLGSVKDIQDRVGVIRQRQAQMQETLKAAREEHEAATDAWFEKQAAFHAENEKWMAESERYLANLRTAKGRNKPGTLRPPPVDTSGDMPRYDENLAAFKAYNKANPD